MQSLDPERRAVRRLPEERPERRTENHRGRQDREKHPLRDGSWHVEYCDRNPQKLRRMPDPHSGEVCDLLAHPLQRRGELERKQRPRERARRPGREQESLVRRWVSALRAATWIERRCAYEWPN